jgi:hypothetical protein
MFPMGFETLPETATDSVAPPAVSPGMVIPLGTTESLLNPSSPLAL